MRLLVGMAACWLLCACVEAETVSVGKAASSRHSQTILAPAESERAVGGADMAAPSIESLTAQPLREAWDPAVAAQAGETVEAQGTAPDKGTPRLATIAPGLTETVDYESGPALSPSEAAQPFDNSRADRFSGNLSLVSGLDHPNARRRSFAAASGAKSWSAEEEAVVRGALAEIGGAYPRFVDRSIRGRYSKLYRFSRFAERRSWLPFSGYQPSESTYRAIADGRKKAFYVFDPFFEPFMPDGEEAWYRSPKYVLMHELVHAFDRSDDIADGEHFLRLMGWQIRTVQGPLGPKTAAGKVRGADYAELARVFDEVQRLRDAGRWWEAIQLDRSTARRHGFPNLYSMVDSRESLAELVTHVALDPLASQYLSAELIEWVKASILD